MLRDPTMGVQRAEPQKRNRLKGNSQVTNLGSTHAHRFIGLTDMNQIKAILREIGLNVLQEVKDLPEIVHPNWLEELEKVEGKIARPQ
jgi:hypothetical protein